MGTSRAVKKRFDLLCRGKEFRSKYGWFRFLIVANTYGMPNPLPKWRGDRESTMAYREHMRGLIRRYVPRQFHSCGHCTRYDECHICLNAATEAAIKEFEEMRGRMLAKKNMALAEWSNRCKRSV